MEIVRDRQQYFYSASWGSKIIAHPIGLFYLYLYAGRMSWSLLAQASWVTECAAKTIGLPGHHMQLTNCLSDENASIFRLGILRAKQKPSESNRMALKYHRKQLAALAGAGATQVSPELRTRRVGRSC